MSTNHLYPAEPRPTLLTIGSGRMDSLARQYEIQGPGFSRVSSCAMVLSLRELAVLRGCGPLLAQLGQRLDLERLARNAKAHRLAEVARHRARHVRAPRP